MPAPPVQAILFYAIAALMVGLHAYRLRAAGDDDAARLRFGAFALAQVRRWQVWRIITYTFVHRSWAHVLLDAAAVAALGTASIWISGFAVAFSDYRLGLWIPLLGFVISPARRSILISASGSPMALAGGLVMQLLLRAPGSLTAPEAGAAALVLVYTAAAFALRGAPVRLMLLALIAGALSSLMAQLIVELERVTIAAM